MAPVVPTTMGHASTANDIHFTNLLFFKRSKIFGFEILKLILENRYVQMRVYFHLYKFAEKFLAFPWKQQCKKGPQNSYLAKEEITFDRFSQN